MIVAIVIQFLMANNSCC